MPDPIQWFYELIRGKKAGLQKLPLEIPAGQGVLRDGDTLITENGRTLPSRCFKCNAPSFGEQKIKFTWLPPWALFFSLTIFLGIWFFVFLVIAADFQKRGSATIHLCERHQRNWLLLKVATWLITFFAVSCVGLGAIFMMGTAAHDHIRSYLFITGASLLFITLVLLGIRGSFIQINRIKDGILFIKGAGQDYLDTFPTRTR